MANCNECKNLNIKLELEDGLKNYNHLCKKHKITLRYAFKRFTGFIWPCVECNGKDFKGKK